MQPVANSSFNVEADQLKTYIEEMNGRKPMAHIRSLPSLDKLIGGVVPGILTIVGAAPAAGKTTLLKVISDDLASQGVPTASVRAAYVYVDYPGGRVDELTAEGLLSIEQIQAALTVG